MAAREDSEKDDFKLTQNEAKTLKEALKKEEFRKLLAEYAEEISNPENKKLYEEEIKRLEQERGVDAKFIHPKPGHVLKTCLLSSKKKLFVNICCSDLINPATPNERETGSLGTMWSIPYSVTPPRDDIDKAHNNIAIIDVIFNGKTYEKGMQIPKFNDLMEATALDSIEKDFKLKIDRKHVRKLKQPYKGTPHPAVIRKRTSHTIPEKSGAFQIPYPPLKEEKEQHINNSVGTSTKQKSRCIIPKYSIVYRGEFDCLDFTYERSNRSVKRPKEIVVTVELPMLNSSADLEVDIHERLVMLNHCDSYYNLEIPLSYPVNEEKSSAKFIKDSSSLILTLPVVAVNTNSHPANQDHSTKFNEHCTVQHDTDILSEHCPQDKTDNETLNEHCMVDANDTLSEHCPQEKADNDKLNEHHTVNNVITSNDTVQWKCPTFSFQQDNKIVSFVLHVKEVKHSCVNSHYDESSAHLTFRDRTCSYHYSFFVLFPSNCLIIPDKSFFKISDERVVLTLTKKFLQNDDNLWLSFNVGINSIKTEKKIFPTEINVSEVVHSVQHTDYWDSVTQSKLTYQLANVSDERTIVTLHDSNMNNSKKEEEPMMKHSESSKSSKTAKQTTPTFANNLLFDLD